MGMDQEQFTSAFLKALKDQEVVETMRNMICGELQRELIELKGIIKTKNDTIEALEKKITEIELRADNLEQYSRRNSLRIHGLNESTTEQENTQEIVMDLLQTKLGIDIDSSGIDRIHRVGRKTSGGKKRPVIVKFATYKERASVFRAKSRLKNIQPGGIFIHEELTKARSVLF